MKVQQGRLTHFGNQVIARQTTSGQGQGRLITRQQLFAQGFYRLSTALHHQGSHAIPMSDHRLCLIVQQL